MATITVPRLTAKTIRRHCGERSFTLGESYWRDRSIFNARRQGQTLKARCQGSRAEAYQVQATLDKKGISDAECSCPVGGGGHCKHVAALLLTWLKQPDEFTQVQSVDAALEQRSKPELIALVKQMLRREPDLELLLEATAGGSAAPASPETYRRQAASAFRSGGYEWGAAGQIADELDAIRETGDGFLEQDDFAGAAAVYQGICSAVVENYETVHDEEGDLHGVVDSCVQGLAKCLNGLKDNAVQREAILRTLWEVSLLDIEQGGISLGEDALELLVEQTTLEERRTIASWVREAMPRGKDRSDSWRRESLGGLLLDLEAETLDDETFLRVCRETGRKHDLVDRLLRLGRLDEAISEAEQASDFELISLADLFVRYRHGEVAERLMQDRSHKSKDSRIVEWLKRLAVQRDDSATALELAEKLFRLQPSLQDYQEVRKLAKKQRRWEEVQPELLAFLRKSPHDQYLLIQVYLNESEIDLALEAVKGKKNNGYGFGYGMELEVAKAAEKTRPRAALEIYRKQAEWLIAQRSRGSYQSACQYLKKVRTLYERLNESATWTGYISRLRDQHSALRALLDEMRKAKL
jgi:uncharacterized Zn finger protein